MTEQTEQHGADAPAPGRMVQNRDVVAHASRKCRTCFGQGTVTLRPVGGEPVTRNCGCAMRRFVARHRADVVEVPTAEAGTVNWQWLSGREPENRAAQ